MEKYYRCEDTERVYTSTQLETCFNNMDEDFKEEYDNDFNVFETAMLIQSGGSLVEIPYDQYCLYKALGGV